MRALALLPLLAAPLRAEPGDRPTLRAGALPASLSLDGALDEPAWAAAEAIPDLVMVEPRQGQPPTQHTEVRVLAGAKALVFGIRCFDTEPDHITSFTKERDGQLEDEDHVVLVLDPFQDGRTGYVFAVNPGGARFDGLVAGGGEDLDQRWDGIWEAATHRDATGWSVEIRVPIEILNFRRGLSEWLFNVQRRVERLQETSRWASPRLDYEVTQTAQAGWLTGLPDFDLGLGLSVRPAAIGGFARPDADSSTEPTGSLALDVTKRLGPSALASLTVNTDFAETESDTRQVNLTRFPLFFPEKRTFFLEGADVFEFGIGLDQNVIPFFSRRIGLLEGQKVPILAGLKLNGRFGRTDVGALATRTREVTGLAPAATMAVLRVKQNVLAESRMGLLATAGDPEGRPGSWEAGVDLTYQTSRFRGSKNFLVGLWGLATGREDLVGDRTAAGLKIDYPNDLWDVAFRYRRIGDGFDPSLGFVPRRAIHDYSLGVELRPRPKSSWLRQMFFEFRPRLVADLGGKWESYQVFTAPVNWQLESGDRFEFNAVPTGERLVEPFEIEDGVVIPPGSYHWNRFRLEAETAAKRRLSGQVTWWFGGFYDGRLDQIEAEGTWTPSPLVSLLFSAEHDRARLSAGDFEQTLLGLKVRLNLSPDLQINSFVQYDTESRSLGTNTRLRWTFRPGGDVFFVYNHGLRRRLDRFAFDSNELLVKVQYAFRR